MTSTLYHSRHPLVRFALSLLLALMILTALVTSGFAAGKSIGKAPPEHAPVIMVGDRLVDVAFNLGVIPEGLSIRGDLWPFGVTLAKTSSTLLGCPYCIVHKKPDLIPNMLRKTGIDTILVEKSVPFDLTKPQRDPMNLPPFLEEKGIINELGTKIEIVDFSAGLDAAIRQIGVLLGKEDKAEKLIASRAAQMEAVSASLPLSGPAPRVVVLDGTNQSDTGKVFVRVHLSGGYIDEFLLTPLGAENVGDELVKSGENGFAALTRLDGLAKVAPDVIVLTGDADGVQRKLFETLRRNPDLGDAVPALSNHAVLSLPAYYDSDVIGYPDILKHWATAFASLQSK